MVSVGNKIAEFIQVTTDQQVMEQRWPSYIKQNPTDQPQVITKRLVPELVLEEDEKK